MRTPGLIGIVAIAAFAVTGCATQTTGSDVPRAATAATRTSGPAAGSKINVGGLKATYHGTADVTHQQKVTIQVADRYFEPTVIHGRPGQTLALNLVNHSQSVHTFTTADGLADIAVQPGSSAAGKITLPRSGKLLFFCRTDKQYGMVGAFVVSGALDSPAPTASAGAT